MGDPNGDRAESEGRSGYWFPLALLGFGLLGLVGLDSVRASQDFGWFSYTPIYSPLSSDSTDLGTMVRAEALLSPGAAYQSWGSFDLAHYPIRGWQWAVLVTATLIATVAWYGRRARRAARRAHVVLAVGGGIAVPAGYVAVAVAVANSDSAGVVTSVGLPLIGLGVLAAVWAYFRLGLGVVALIGVVCLVVGVSTVIGAWSPGMLDPMIIAGGLLALAKYERSRLLAVVAVAVLVAMAVFPIGTLTMLIPAAMLLATAIVVLVRQSGATQPA
jgi:hypothetical protein